MAMMSGPEETELGTDPLPIVETDLSVIQHYNKQNMRGFEKAGYFILRDVIVCERGKKDEVRNKLHKNLDGFTSNAPIGGIDMRKKS
jgi:hypothetical protein